MYKIKKCKNCKTDFKAFDTIRNLCEVCLVQKTNQQPLKVQKSIKKVSSKKIERLKKTWGEIKTFEKVWKNRPHACQICWEIIPEAKAFCFAHLLNKAMYPHLRDFENNINLVCSIECHKETDLRLAKSNKQEIEQAILDWKYIFI